MVRCPQDRRRVDGGDDESAVGSGTRRTSVARDAQLGAEQGLTRGRAERDDHLRAHRAELGLEPRRARGDLTGGRLLVETQLSAPLELEVLDRVREVGVLDAE